jgi:tetratricopeptide (TPR) repeat protein
MQYEIDWPTFRVLTEARNVREGRGARGRAAADLYKRVIEKFPNHARALGELAAMYGDLGAQFPTAPATTNPPTASIAPDEARRLLLPLARKALDIDDSVAEAHAALGFFYALDLDFDKAQESFERAIDLDPTSSTLRGDYVMAVLVPQGELNKAIKVLNDALEDDPESLDLRRILARVQLNAGQFAGALRNSRRVLARDPTFPFASNFAAWALLHLGEKAEALAWFNKYYLGDDGLEGTQDDRTGARGWIHAIKSERAEADKIAGMPLFRELPLRRVEIYGLLGDAEKTLDALEDQVDLNPLRAAFYLTYPELHFLKGNPRFEALRERLTGR